MFGVGILANGRFTRRLEEKVDRVAGDIEGLIWLEGSARSGV
jgi:hypothetical protein